jgi:hypothetical protein
MNEPSEHAILTLLAIDCSSSIRTNGILADLIAAANDTLAQLRAAGSLVSVVYFNNEIGFHVWRTPARDVPQFSEFNVPVDYGTRLFDAIKQTVDRLVAEHDASNGETNADVNILIFTDGMDSCSKEANLMGARLALGLAKERGFRVTFVTAVEGLAADLGLSQRETILISASPKGVREGFREATVRFGTEDMRRAAEAMRIDREAKDLAKAASAPAPAPPTAKRRRPWWRLW